MFVLVCELLLLCLLGYASRKFHAVDGSFASSLSSLMIDIVIPCYVLKAMLETDDLMQLLRDGLNACLVALAVMAVLFVLGSLVKRLTGGGIGRIMRFGTMFSNALIFGMPIAETYWGTPGLICLMAFYPPIRFGYYGLSELLLSPEETSGKGHWKHALHILYSPAVLAFVIGGAICVLGQVIQNGWTAAGLDQEAAGTATACTLVALSALLTGLNLYNKIARFAGAGTLVPITGFANSVVSPAIDFKAEGLITGTAVKMFTIAGPVIVYGTVAAMLYGVVLMIFG